MSGRLPPRRLRRGCDEDGHVGGAAGGGLPASDRQRLHDQRRVPLLHVAACRHQAAERSLNACDRFVCRNRPASTHLHQEKCCSQLRWAQLAQLAADRPTSSLRITAVQAVLGLRYLSQKTLFGTWGPAFPGPPESAGGRSAVRRAGHPGEVAGRPAPAGRPPRGGQQSRDGGRPHGAVLAPAPLRAPHHQPPAPPHHPGACPPPPPPPPHTIRCACPRGDWALPLCRSSRDRTRHSRALLVTSKAV